VGIGSRSHPELEGVDAEFLLQLQADFQGRARILVLKHLLLLDFGSIQVGIVPGLVIGELVIGRQEGMCLAVTFYLGNFNEGF